MEHVKRLRCRREQYRARRDRETSEDRRQRLVRHREYDGPRYSALSIDERRDLYQRRRRQQSQDTEMQQPQATDTQQTPQLTNDLSHHIIPPFDDPSIIRKVSEYHNDLMSLTFNQCLENFPSLKINTAGICAQCHGDKHLSKLYSAQNNIDPGPVPPELTVSHLLSVQSCHVYSYRDWHR